LAIYHHTYAKDGLLDTFVTFIAVSISGHIAPKTKQIRIAVSIFRQTGTLPQDAAFADHRLNAHHIY
jgi:hypothetical protein